ncbi:MAG TPA: hypothetical protein VI874_00675, partial [Candidatus Norongarragalinales archaeon]|nr:hypothetical protein [Candidatus Norongarragalinales archaeon]
MPSKKEDDKETKAKEAKVQEPKSESPKSQIATGFFPKDASYLKAKLPLLFLILLFFSFAGFLFDRANFHAVDLVDLSRLQYNVPKLYSLTFLLFLVLFALVLALSVHFGFGTHMLHSLLVLPAALLPAIALGFLFPKLLMVFAALALTAAAASVFASRQKELGLSTAWNVLGRAMLVLMLLAFLVTYIKIGGNASYYSDRLFDSAFDLVPDIGKQLSAVVASTDIDDRTLRGLISQDTYKKSVSPKTVQAAIERIPGIKSFNQSLRETWAKQVQEQLTTEDAYNQFINSSVDAVKEIKAKFAQQIENQTAAPDASLKKIAASEAKKIP